MASLTSGFGNSFASDLAADIARSAVPAEVALSAATAAFDRAEMLRFTSYTTRTSTLVSGTLENGERATLRGSDLLSAKATHDIRQLHYVFADQTTAVLKGEWIRFPVIGDIGPNNRPFMGDVDSAVVTAGGGSVTFTGIRRPADEGRTGLFGFDNQPAVGEGRISAIRFDKEGASIVYGGVFLADTVSVDGQLSSTIEGTVKSIKLTSGATQLTLSGLALAARDVLEADFTDILAMALAGRDTLTGTAASQVLDGFGGDDSLDGGAGFDTLVGGDGNDTLNGGADSDILVGGAGDDTYILDRSTDAVAEDPDWGVDHVILSFLASGADTLARNVENGTIATRKGVLVALTGNDLDNVLAGSANADTLHGGAGADTLAGNAGNDRLHGGAGDDTLRGGAGSDAYHFGAGGGHDLIQENDATAKVIDTVWIEAGSGNPAGGEVRFSRGTADADDLVLTIFSGELGGVVDTLTIDEFFASDAINTRAAIEQFRFVDGNVTLSAAQAVAEMLKGTAGADAIRGTSGNNSINGREGDDSIAGAAGNDTLIGHWGDDQLAGDAGADLLQGNLGADTLAGGDGNDILDGGAAADSLDGGAGNDVLLGGTGDDVLAGGTGMDTLTGGAGDDTLTGGEQADRFVLNSLAGTDTITDFVSGIDKVAVHKSVFTGITAPAGTAARTAEALGPAFAYDVDTGRLTYDVDGVESSAPAVVAQFTPGQALAADFLVIG